MSVLYIRNRNGELVPVRTIQGEPGRGIESIEKTSGDGSPGATDVYTITFTDGTTSTFTVYNGADGSGSPGLEGFNPAAYGLPMLALTGDTSAMSKDNAVTLNYVYGDRSGTCTVKWQGNSSLAYPKKNYTIKFDQEFEAVEGWGAQKKYCLKADFIDFSHTRNVVSAKLWGQMVRSRSGGTIDQIKALPNGGAVDGFPCVVTINGEFTGVYNFNIPKDGWMFGMGSGQQEAIVCAENYVFDKAVVVDGTDLELEYVSDENNAAWVAESLNRLVTAVLNSDGTDIDTTIAQYLDIDSAIDYLIFTVMNYGTDNTGKNYILATYDGVKWFFSAYDMDGVWGLRWDGKTFFSADINHAISAGSLKGYARVHALMNLLYTHKYSAIQKRYWELRAGPLSDGNVEKTFTDYASQIHRTLLEEDARLWPTISSTETNDVSQILGWFHTRREGMDADVGQLEETGVTYYPDINGFIRLNGSVSTSANYRRTDYLPLAGVKEIEYLSFVVKGSNMATWALFDQNKNWIVSSQDENGTEYYNINIAGNTVTYGLLRKTLLVEELLEQYPSAAYIVLSTNNHADYEAKMDINNVNFGWSSEKQYITLRSVSGENDTDREPGGYYTPAVEQIDSETMEVRFRPSSDTMPDVQPVQISLPAGPHGPKGDTGETGPQGPAGSDASVTKNSINAALGYTPSDPRDYAVSVKALGAKGDGSTDDTAVFQSALAGYRRVYVPGGTYKLSGELLILENCELELSQDTVLEFTMTSGNCISMKYSASIRGHHATVRVPYKFGGNVIYVSSTLDTNVLDTPPFKRWDPQWKSGRYITDLNIVMPDSRGFHYCDNLGDCSGTAVYMCADGKKTVETASTFIWGLNFSGLRIAGAFSYGIRAQNFNAGWNHEMRIEALIDACEIGVSIEDCNNAFLNAVVQPRAGYTNETKPKEFPYAKHGIQLIRSKNTDMSGSRVWDWSLGSTLWEAGGQYQHIALYGECVGTIMNNYRYHDLGAGVKDLRELIYTDTPSNFDSLIVLQEPITRWFKPIDYKPYFNNGVDGDQRLVLKSEQDALFNDSLIALFTNQLPRATDETGAVFYEKGYKQGSYWEVDGKTLLTDQYNNCIATGYLPVNGNSLIRMHGIKLTLGDNFDRIILFDDSKTKIRHINSKLFISGSYFATYTETDDGCEIQLTASETARYVKLNFMVGKFTPNAVITVDEEIIYEQAGFLADGIYVNGKYVTGLGDLYMRQNQKVLAISAESTDEQYPTAKAVYDYIQQAIAAAMGQ